MNGLYALAILVAGVAAAASALYTAVWGPRARARRRLATGTSTIEDHTIVTLVGTVRATRTLRAPLSNAACVAFVAHGNMFIYGAPSEDFGTQEMVPFELVTQDGVVQIEATTVEIVHEPRSLIPRNVDLEAKFLVAHGYNVGAVRNTSFTQATIVDGDKVQVQGLALVEPAPPDDAMGYRNNRNQIRLVAHDAHPLTIGPTR